MTHHLWVAQNLMTHPSVRAQNLVTHPPFPSTHHPRYTYWPVPYHNAGSSHKSFVLRHEAYICLLLIVFVLHNWKHKKRDLFINISCAVNFSPRASCIFFTLIHSDEYFVLCDLQPGKNSGLNLQLRKLQSQLQWSQIHFIWISAVQIIFIQTDRCCKDQCSSILTIVRFVAIIWRPRYSPAIINLF